MVLQRQHLDPPRILLAYPRGGLQLGKWMDCKVLATSGKPHLETQPNQPVDSKAYDEINQAAPVQQKSLVAQHGREVRHERRIIDRVSQKYGYEVFDPPSNWGAKKVASHEFPKDCRLRLGSVAAAAFRVSCEMQRAVVLPNSAHAISSVEIGLCSGRRAPPFGTQRAASPLRLLLTDFRPQPNRTQTAFRPANRWYKSDVPALARSAPRPDAHRSI